MLGYRVFILTFFFFFFFFFFLAIQFNSIEFIRCLSGQGGGGQTCVVGGREGRDRREGKER